MCIQIVKILGTAYRIKKKLQGYREVDVQLTNRQQVHVTTSIHSATATTTTTTPNNTAITIMLVLLRLSL